MHFNQTPFALCAVLAKLWVSWQPLLKMLRELYLKLGGTLAMTHAY